MQTLSTGRQTTWRHTDRQRHRETLLPRVSMACAAFKTSSRWESMSSLHSATSDWIIPCSDRRLPNATRLWTWSQQHSSVTSHDDCGDDDDDDDDDVSVNTRLLVIVSADYCCSRATGAQRYGKAKVVVLSWRVMTLTLLTIKSSALSAEPIILMQWWTRPGPSRPWAISKPRPSPSRMLSAATRTLSNVISAWPSETFTHHQRHSFHYSYATANVKNQSNIRMASGLWNPAPISPTFSLEELRLTTHTDHSDWPLASETDHWTLRLTTQTDHWTVRLTTEHSDWPLRLTSETVRLT